MLKPLANARLWLYIALGAKWAVQDDDKQSIVHTNENQFSLFFYEGCDLLKDEYLRQMYSRV